MSRVIRWAAVLWAYQGDNVCGPSPLSCFNCTHVNTCQQHSLCPCKQNNNTYCFLSLSIASVCGRFVLYGFLSLLWKIKLGHRYEFDSLPPVSLLRFSGLRNLFFLALTCECIGLICNLQLHVNRRWTGRAQSECLYIREHKRAVDLE